MGIPRARQGIIAVLLLFLFLDEDDDMALVFEVLPLSQERHGDDTAAGEREAPVVLPRLRAA